MYLEYQRLSIVSILRWAKSRVLNTWLCIKPNNFSACFESFKVIIRNKYGTTASDQSWETNLNLLNALYDDLLRSASMMSDLSEPQSVLVFNVYTNDFMIKWRMSIGISLFFFAVIFWNIVFLFVSWTNESTTLVRLLSKFFEVRYWLDENKVQ